MKKIYIDAGHGEGVTGRPDPGAVGPTGTTENSITFDIAKRLGHLLRAKGFTALGQTLQAAQDTENFNEAIAAANSQGADYYVSLHCNAATTPSARGFEVWHGSSQVAQALATAVSRRVGEQLTCGMGHWARGKYPLVNRGIKLGEFAVLRKTRMPSILVELAFISNSQEEAWLKEPAVRQQFAQAIADAIGDIAG